MKYLYFAVLIMLVLMSLSAGGAKVANMPQEIQFFVDAGISPTWLLPLGAFQIIGGLLAIYHRTRRAGVALIAIGFLVSTIVIFMTGNSGFAAFSLIPILLCALVFWQSPRS